MREAVAYGATELCMQSGIHPDWALEDYEGWLRIAKDEAPQLHLHAYSPMEIDADGDVSGLPPARCSRGCATAGLGSGPGHRGRGARRRRARADQPEQAAGRRWVEIIEAAHRAGLRSTVTVMFGHIEEP